MNNSMVVEKCIRRIASALLAIAVLASFAGCAALDALTAYGLYSGATKKLKKAGGCEVDCVMNISTDIFGESMDVSVEMNCKQNGNDIQTTVNLLDENVITTRLGDTVYVEYEDSKVKYHVEEGDGKTADNVLGNVDLPKLTKDILEDVEVVKDDNGNKTITVSLGDESDLIKELLGSEYEDMTLEDVVIQIVFNKKNDIVTMKISGNTTMNVLGTTFGGTITAEYTFINFGTAPEISINYPADEYEDGGEYQG